MKRLLFGLVLILGFTAPANSQPPFIVFDLNASNPLIINSTMPSYGKVTLTGADVNGDGYGDLILVIANFGAAFVVYGSSNPSSVTLSLSGGPQYTVIPGTSDGPKKAADGVGDVNGDGFEDIVIVMSSGVVNLFLGGTNWGPGLSAPSAVATFSVPSPPSWTFLSAAGDVNGDVYHDILFVLNPPHHPTLVYGSPTLSGTVQLEPLAVPGVTLVPGPTTFGSTAVGAGVGDVNADGFDDFVVGNSLIYGSAGLPASMQLAWTGTLLLPNTALLPFYSPPLTFVQPAGDVNLDGFGDVAFAVSGGPDPLLLYGAASLPNYITNFQTLPPGMGGVNSLATGDFNNDGKGDVAAAHYSAVVTGRFWFSGSDAWHFTVTFNGSPDGTNTAALDFNGDGFDDLAFLRSTGLVYVVFGGPIPIRFGTSCPPAGTAYGSQNFLRLGLPVTLSLTGTGNAYALLLGLSNTTWSGMNLPLDMGWMGMPGCTLYVAPDIVAFLPTNNYSFTVPNDPTLVGNPPIYAQWLIASPPTNPAGLILSNALSLTFGF